MAKRLAADPVRRALANAVNRDRIPLDFCIGRNWGDALSPVMVELLSGKRVVHLEGLYHDRFMVIGSILERANERSVVWGSGFIRESGVVVGHPKKVHAVRGPLSREILLRQGVECPEIFGDPALLFPRFFDPIVDKRYSVGIIPHYTDKGNEWVERYRLNPQVLVIDIESSIQDFVRSVKSCQTILSSSLHGLICADAYGIPNTWVILSDEVVGGDFKFRDYRHSIGAGEPEALRLNIDVDLLFAVEKAKLWPLDIDLRELFLACPFLSGELRSEVMGSRLLPAKVGTSMIPVI